MNFRISNTNNPFSSSDASLSRLRSDFNGSGESDFKGLSDKDKRDVTQGIKDELEYQISIGKADQGEGWNMDEIERTFGIFGD